jgi:hypothetical protein
VCAVHESNLAESIMPGRLAHQDSHQTGRSKSGFAEHRMAQFPPHVERLGERAGLELEDVKTLPHCVPPLVVLITRIVKNVLVSLGDDSRDLLFITVLVELTVELLRDLRDVWKCPSAFRESEHLAFGFRERSVFTLCFRDDLGNQELLGFTSIVDSIHAANSTL